MPQAPYFLLGGEPGLRELVARFYELMDGLPESAGIRAMHAEDLAPMREKLFLYLSEWLGGPRLYSERTGSMCLNAPHEPFPIGEAERDQWLLCMRRALEETGASEEVQGMLREPLFRVADFLRNQ